MACMGDLRREQLQNLGTQWLAVARQPHDPGQRLVILLSQQASKQYGAAAPDRPLSPAAPSRTPGVSVISAS